LVGELHRVPLRLGVKGVEAEVAQPVLSTTRWEHGGWRVAEGTIGSTPKIGHMGPVAEGKDTR
jgi:hypothetical protein